MKRLLTSIALLVAFASPAWADFDSGLSAYMRSDYRAAYAEFAPLADQGNADAQNMLGYMYARGQGVPQDFVQAHVWFNLAAAAGKGGAADSRDEMAKLMSPSQIAEAQGLARQWRPAQAMAETSPATPASTATSGLSEQELVAAIQENLNALGYNAGPADGAMGRRTRSAIRGFQLDQGLPIDGVPTEGLLASLRAARGSPQTESAAAPAPQPEPEIASAPAPGPAVASDNQTQAIIDRLRELIEKGRQERSISQGMRAELRALADQYDWPWRVRVLIDDFADGNFTANPAWAVTSGEFWIDRYEGLRTRLEAPAKQQQTSQGESGDAASVIIGTILAQVLKPQQQQGTTQAAAPTEAAIHAAAGITNAFALEIELRALPGTPGQSIELGPYQGERRDWGYRLSYAVGDAPTLELTRQSPGRSSVIELSDSVPALDDGARHTVQWRRAADGAMVVLVDGAEVMRATDRAILNPFDGVSILNRGGDYAISRISVEGAAP